VFFKFREFIFWSLMLLFAWILYAAIFSVAGIWVVLGVLLGAALTTAVLVAIDRYFFNGKFFAKNNTDSDWQPIETAPKDGTKILVWDGSSIEFACWEDDGLDTSDWSHKAGWQIANAGYDGDSDYSDKVTHWKPLRPPELN
jgi:hypothetical protein